MYACQGGSLLTDWRGHVTDGKTHFQASVISYLLTDFGVFQLIRLWNANLALERRTLEVFTKFSKNL